MKFTDADFEPVDGGDKRSSVAAMIAELSAQPGRWAEIARYSLERKGSAKSRGSQTAKRYPELQYTVAREGDEFVLYFRVPKP